MSRPSPRPLLVAALLAALLLVVAGCSGDDEDAATTTTAATAPTTAATTDAGNTEMPRAIADRLTDELGDPEIAAQVVANLDPTLLQQLQLVVPVDQVATTPLLSYRPEPVDGPVDHLVVLSFGNRVAEDGTVSAGPVNEALADAVQAHVAEQPTPVYAQWEVARILQERGVPDVVSIEPQLGADGTPTYLSTSGVTDQVVQRAQADGVDLGTVGVVGFADHVVRGVMTAEASGMDAVVVRGIELPTDYDPGSGQEWTRDRVTYVTVDLSGRIATA